MLNKVSYSCTALNGLNKVGKIRQGEDGYYEVILGGLNVRNTRGELYTYEHAKELFEASGVLQRRIQRGALRSENGHPVKEVGMTMKEYAGRLMSIRESRVCAHIRKVDLVFDKIRDKDGKPIVAIVGYVKPSGELGYVLRDALQNPNENIAFSIRAFTDDVETYRGLERRLHNIVTWDFVGEPGLPIAEKYNSPSLESYEDITFKRRELTEAVQSMAQTGVATESDSMNAQALFQSLGWTTAPARPSFAQW